LFGRPSRNRAAQTDNRNRAARTDNRNLGAQTDTAESPADQRRPAEPRTPRKAPTSTAGRRPGVRWQRRRTSEHPPQHEDPHRAHLSAALPRPGR